MVRFDFNYRPTTCQLWKLSMYGIMNSKIGVTNIIFSLFMLFLALLYWSRLNMIFKIILLIAISLFTIIQPAIIYMGARRQVNEVPDDMRISFSDQGICISSSKGKDWVKWKDVKGISRVLDMTIIYSTEIHGFIISDRTLGSERKSFYQYVENKYKKR